MIHDIIPTEETGSWKTGDSSRHKSELVRTRIQAPSTIVSDGPTGQMLLEMRIEEKPFLFLH